MEINFLDADMQAKKENTHTINPRKPHLLPALLCLFILSTSTNSLHAGYLDELEAEADVSTSDRIIKSPEQSKRKRLESMLKNQQPGTFAFYKKLTSENKEAVLESFSESEKLSITKKKIFDLYFAQDK